MLLHTGALNSLLLHHISVLLLRQPPFEGLSQLPAAKKVTFDLTESDLSSAVDAQGQTGPSFDQQLCPPLSFERVADGFVLSSLPCQVDSPPSPQS